MPDSLTVRAPAKLNLALAVGPPSTSGMHPICSWMLTIDLFDELLVTRLEEDRFSRYAILWHEEAKRPTEINWSITSDLAVRAHLAMEDRLRRRLPIQLKLDKRIPVGGGLGGGSSDAAAMLRAVNELYELGLSVDELVAIGADLGSDVPFFIRGGSAIVQGLGEQVQLHQHMPELYAVVAFPDMICPTGRVYRLFDEMSPSVLRDDAVHKLASISPASPRPDALFNDLTRAALKAAPGLDQHIAALAELAERPSHVAGSGSSIFVLCDDPLHAEALAGAVESRLRLPAVAVRAHMEYSSPASQTC